MKVSRRKDWTNEKCSDWLGRIGDNNKKRMLYDTEGNNSTKKGSQDLTVALKKGVETYLLTSRRVRVKKVELL